MVAVVVAVMLPMELLPTASAPRAGVRSRRGRSRRTRLAAATASSWTVMPMTTQWGGACSPVAAVGATAASVVAAGRRS